MNARQLTIAESTKAARNILARSHLPVDVQGWIVETVLREIGTGFHVPATAYADADDVRTQGKLSAWLRRHAVDTAAEGIAKREGFEKSILDNLA